MNLTSDQLREVKSRPAIAKVNGGQIAPQTTCQVESKADVKSEKELQNLCANYLRQLGIPFICPVFGKKTQITVGWPDFTFPYRGRFYGVECKVGANHITPEQARCLAAIETQGGIQAVVRTFEQFVNLFK